MNASGILPAFVLSSSAVNSGDSDLWITIASLMPASTAKEEWLTYLMSAIRLMAGAGVRPPAIG